MKHRYKIEVSGLGICEYYEYDHKYSEAEVAQDWLSDASERLGAGVASTLSDRVEVTRLTDDGPQQLE